jgi:hypothetical protein
VPECPVFSIFRIFFIQATISWDDGLLGLSRFIIPYFKYSSRGLFNGVEPEPTGV